MKSKKQIRQNIKSKIQKLDNNIIKKKSKKIFEELKKYTDKYQTWFIFLSKENEFQTKDLISFLIDKGKKILIPHIDKNNMKTVIYKKNMDLKIGKFGILETKNPIFFQGKIDIAIVPGLAFTKNGKRLGKGGGFYDKFFEKNKNIFKIGVSFSEQIINEIPTEKYDISMNKVLYDG